MRQSLFQAKSYKNYLNARLDEPPLGGRGARSRLATQIASQSSFVAQVLRGPQHFSVEQAEAINIFLSHTEDEAEYFLLLVQRDRAGTHALRERMDKQMQKLRENYEELKDRLKVNETLIEKDLARFYSSWAYAAVHICLLIPELQNLKVLAERLELPLQLVNEVVDFLVQTGLLERDGTKLVPGKTRSHLGSQSPFLKSHHLNWRLQAMHAIERAKKDSFHFSGIFTLSRADALQAREDIMNLLERFQQRLPASKDEVPLVLNIDWFQY